ncbi:hypothetical protein Q4555_04410 [Octadecabacter sp. 1_MG-2023]|uniref:hypothetical protein n=1 Tax=unclassified Octadecabacter TaxID=196158 RepID=UPI001C08111D|nr:MULTISPECIES: hypothetical protein [unclassified Octadecabacter]MBU2992653.1 hypothetical protein [Octadecabacter sp. B2R22]MDO6733896.1 hypothetical protein [Octadecabacter sp. 1_MG-2023]
MSEPVTNVEIEDVLTSIRRLVSDGDKARTRDTAPIAAELEAVLAVPSSDNDTPESDSAALPDKLVLTPAFLVGGSTEQSEAPEDEGEGDQVEAANEGEADLADQFADASDDDDDVVPLELTDMVWDDAHEQDDDGFEDDGDDGVHVAVETPDRSELVATIAELEAAISSGEDDYEPDGSEIDVSEHMAKTIAWPGTIARSAEQIRDAETAETLDEDDVASIDDDDKVMEFHHKAVDDLVSVADQDEAAMEDVSNDENVDPASDDSKPEAPDTEADVYADDDLDGLLEAGGVALDEEALRALVSDVVREELSGPLGERITRNVRKLVRREIYRVLSSQEFD